MSNFDWDPADPHLKTARQNSRQFTRARRSSSRCTISSYEEVMCSRLMRIAIRKWRLGHYIKWKFNWSQTIMRCARNHAGQEWHSLCVSAALTPSPPPPSRFSLAFAPSPPQYPSLSLPLVRVFPHSRLLARASLHVERIKFHISPLPSRGSHSHDAQLLAFPAI